ncbi:MAG: asparagine synthetase B family protein [Acidobacteriota bacterium]
MGSLGSGLQEWATKAAEKYRAGGEEALTDFLGSQQAVLLADPQRHRLLLYRDRVGIQDLYFVCTAETTWLSTRVESLLTVGAISGEPDLEVCSAMLCGVAPSAQRSAYRDLGALGAGERLSVDSDGVEVRRYWSPWPDLGTQESAAPKDAKPDSWYEDRFERLLREILLEQTPGRGSVACTLSAGLDSSTVATLLREVRPKLSITAVTFSSPDFPQEDEGPLAAEVAAGGSMESLELRLDRHWPLSRPDGLVVPRGLPLGNRYREVWEQAFEALSARGISTLFTGVSGDNLFPAAVSPYADQLLQGRWATLWRDARAHLGGRWSLLPRLLRYRLVEPLRAHWRGFDPPAPPAWLTGKGRALAAPWLVRRKASEESPGRTLHRHWMEDPWLPLAVQELGRQARSHGIEFRHPLLDHRLMEFAARLPPRQVTRAGWTKHLLRRVMKDRLPSGILREPGKKLPKGVWVRGLVDREGQKVRALMTEMRCAELGLVDAERLSQEYESFAQDRRGTLKHLWAVLSLEAWLRGQFV